MLLPVWCCWQTAAEFWLICRVSEAVSVREKSLEVMKPARQLQTWIICLGTNLMFWEICVLFVFLSLQRVKRVFSLSDCRHARANKRDGFQGDVYILCIISHI